MDDLAVRVVIVVVVAAAAVGTGLLARSRKATSQPVVDLVPLGLEETVVAFTSTNCENCKQVMLLLSGFDIPLREAAFEREPELFDRAGVDAVPLVVVPGRDGRRGWQRGGKLRHGTVRRALARAGW